MGAEAVTKGVGGDVFVFFGKTGFGGGELDGIPHGGFGHGIGAAVKGLAQGDAGVFPKATYTGEEPFWVFMVGVEFAQAGKELGGDGYFTGFAVFGLGNVDDEALAVDLTGLDGECFVEAQSGLID